MTDELISEVKKMNRLLIQLLIKDFSQTDRILYLHTSGYSPKEISEILNTTPNTVRVTLSRVKKRKK